MSVGAIISRTASILIKRESDIELENERGSMISGSNDFSRGQRRSCGQLESTCELL